MTTPLPAMSPLRLLLLAVLSAVVLAQVAGLFLLARSQVQKAELRAIAEQTARLQAANCSESRGAACRMPPPSVGDSGFITAGYAPSR